MQIRDAKILTAIGMMSGTSMDGIDMALLRTDGEGEVQRIGGAEYPYDAAFRNALARALDTARAIVRREERPGDLAAIEQELTLRHARALETFLEKAGIASSSIDVIGFHGQTVLHRPERGLTFQIGDGQLLASTSGIPVVFDMRARDMEEGGQGAPLVPVYHRALAEGMPAPWKASRPVVFVNIGGISNVTWIDANGGMLAFDTGPGNSLIDQWVMQSAGIPYDQDGRIAAEGSIVPSLVGAYLENGFFARKLPKSLDRNDFLPPPAGSVGLEDGARSLARLTAEAIFRSLDHLPERPRLWIVCGGGRLNPSIMSDMRELAAARDSEAITAEQAGMDGGSMEAEAWAYLAVRSLRGLPLTWPGTTGCRNPVSGGKLVFPGPAESLAASR